MRTTCIYSQGLRRQKFKLFLLSLFGVHLGYIKIVICNRHQADLYFQPFSSRSGDSILGPCIPLTTVSKVLRARKSSELSLKEVPP